MGMMMESKTLSFVGNYVGRVSSVNERRLSKVVQFDQSTAFRMRELEKELQQYRYRMEQMVQEKTEMLNRRIAILESCNSKLCDSYAQIRKQYYEALDQTQSELIAYEAEASAI